jgi:hypothetical protein
MRMNHERDEPIRPTGSDLGESEVPVFETWSGRAAGRRSGVGAVAGDGGRARREAQTCGAARSNVGCGPVAVPGPRAAGFDHPQCGETTSTATWYNARLVDLLYEAVAMKLAAMRSEVQECERRLQGLALAGSEGSGGADPASEVGARAGAERVRWQRERERQRRDQLLRDIACLAVLETS